jgi:pimeloyl-ACP methyl ester carboxylesterase
VDWPGDVIQVAAALGLDRFAVLGISGGTPYAAACAWELSDRLTAAGSVSGLAPVDVPGVIAGMGRQNRLAGYRRPRATAHPAPHVLECGSPAKQTACTTFAPASFLTHHVDDCRFPSNRRSPTL